MTGQEESGEYRETAIGYAISALTYVQNGGKLSDIEATASEILRLASQELGTKVPGALKATVLMDSVEEMRLRHNSLHADAVFSDMMAQARNAGRLTTRKRENVQGFKDIAPEVVAAYEDGTYVRGANPAADHLVNLIKKHGKWVVLAASALMEHKPEDFSDVPVDKAGEFLEESYLGCGATVGRALEAYAKDQADSGTGTELARLYDRLDKAGGVDRFDWGSYATDDMTPTVGLHFVTMPVPAGEAGAFVFGN